MVGFFKSNVNNRKFPLLYTFSIVFFISVMFSASVSYYLYQNESRIWQKHEKERNYQLMLIQHRIVDRYLLSPLKDLTLFSSLNSFHEFLNKESNEEDEINSFIKGIIKSKKRWLALYFIDVNNKKKLFFKSPEMGEMVSIDELMKEPEFQRVKNESISGIPQVGFWEVNKNGKYSDVLRYVKPIFSINGTLSGYLYLLYDTAPLKKKLFSLPWERDRIGKIFHKNENIEGFGIYDYFVIPPFRIECCTREASKVGQLTTPYYLTPINFSWTVVSGLSVESMNRIIMNNKIRYVSLFFMFFIWLTIFSFLYSINKVKSEKLKFENIKSKVILQKIIDHMPQIIFWLSRENLIFAANKKFLKIYNSDEDSFELYKPIDMVRVKEVPHLSWLPENYNKIGSRKYSTMIGNKILTMEINSVQMYDADGRSNGALFSCIDISEKERLQEDFDRNLKNLKEEMDIAGKVLKSMLRKDFSKFKGIKVETAWFPSREVGGDFFDFISLSDERIGVYLFDVIGHGVPAALNTALGRYTFSNCINSSLEKEKYNLSLAFETINKDLVDNLGEDRFISALLLLIDLKNKKLLYSNGGAPPVLVMNNSGEIKKLHTPGMFLGLMKETTYAQEELDIESGDRIFLFTDGVTETKNSKNELFEVDRLIDILKENRDVPISNLKQIILKELRDFRGTLDQGDDLTLIIIEIV